MALREILWFPHETLREDCAPVDKFDEALHALLDDMIETMYDANGVGLAAPQIGVAKRVTVIDTGQGDERGGESLLELINPKILERSEEQKEGEEGCLSFPDQYGPVSRSVEVLVEAQNRDGETFTVDASGLLAVALQHELDHLDGVLFVDHMSRLRSQMIQKKMRKRVKQRHRANKKQG